MLTCDVCGREFGRREHLERHQVVHSGQKPFECRLCTPHKRYARQDVYKRHLRQKHGLNERSIGTLKRRQRSRTACDNCHARKVKCNSPDRPCERCRVAGLTCSSGITASVPQGQDASQFYHLHDSLDTLAPSEDTITPDTALFLSDAQASAGDDLVSTALLEQDPFSMFPNDVTWWDSFLPESHNNSNFFPDGLSGQLSLSFDASRTTAAYAKLYEFTGMSHPDNPSSAPEQSRYLQELGSTEPFNYDAVILNVFVGLFREHLAPKFPGFPKHLLPTDVPEALYLAMAANGGMYCKTPKSETVAKGLLFAAGRSLLTLKHSQILLTPLQKLYICQTHLLMEAFAHICGDSRLIMLVNIYASHGAEVFRTFEWSELDSQVVNLYRSSLETARDLNTVYRVVLLQKRALIYPTSGLHQSYESEQQDTSSVSNIVKAIVSGQVQCPLITSQNASIRTLCTLSILASHTHRLHGSLAKRARQQKRRRVGPRADTFELFLHKWLYLHEDSSGPDPDTLLLYHLVHFSIYINLGQLSQIIREYLTRQIAVQATTFSACFWRDEYQAKAVWHARKMLVVAAQVPFCSRRAPAGTFHLMKRPTSNEPVGESIHYTHAVYSAAMILWGVEITANGDDQSGRNSCPAGAVQVLNEGILLLQRAKARVAEVYIETMRRLLGGGVT